MSDTYLYVFLYFGQYLESRGQHWHGVIPSYFPFSLRQGFINSDVLARAPGICFSLPASTGKTAHTAEASFLYGCWGFKLRSSSLHGKHFTNWVISQPHKLCFNQILQHWMGSYMYLKLSHPYSSSFKMQKPSRDLKFPFQHFLLKLLVSSKFTFTKSTHTFSF